jgi:hypothetical protein
MVITIKKKVEERGGQKKDGWICSVHAVYIYGSVTPNPINMYMLMF